MPCSTAPVREFGFGSAEQAAGGAFQQGHVVGHFAKQHHFAVRQAASDQQGELAALRADRAERGVIQLAQLAGQRFARTLLRIDGLAAFLALETALGIDYALEAAGSSGEEAR